MPIEVESGAGAPVVRALVYSGLTLYMMVILLRWCGPWLQIPIDGPRLRWTGRIVEPLLSLIRRHLPAMGPMDWSPVFALLGVWIIRMLFAGM